MEWPEDIRIPDVKGATFFRRKWAAKPLFRVGQNLVEGSFTTIKRCLKQMLP